MALHEKVTPHHHLVIVQLDYSPSHTTTASGITVPLAETATTDGGKPTTNTSSRKYLSQGTIVALSSEASTHFSLNQRVQLQENLPIIQYQYFLPSPNLVKEFTGLIIVPYELITTTILDSQESV